MTQTYLLDTNILVAYQNGEEAVAGRIEAQAVVTTSIVLGELYFGAFKSVRVGANLSRVETTRLLLSVLSCDEETSKIYGDVKNQLRAKGRPIPDNDIWIAATALQHDLVLASRDAHFGSVDGLKLEIW